MFSPQHLHFMNARRVGLHDIGCPCDHICCAAVVTRTLFTGMYTQPMVIRTAAIQCFLRNVCMVAYADSSMN